MCVETAVDDDDDVDQPPMSARGSAVKAGDDTDIPATHKDSEISAASSEGEGVEWVGEAAEYSRAEAIEIEQTKAIASFWCVYCVTGNDIERSLSDQYYCTAW